MSEAMSWMVRNTSSNTPKLKKAQVSHRAQRSLTSKDVHAIHQGKRAGVAQVELARKYGVTQSVVSKILRGVNYTEIWAEYKASRAE